MHAFFGKSAPSGRSVRLIPAYVVAFFRIDAHMSEFGRVLNQETNRTDAPCHFQKTAEMGTVGLQKQVLVRGLRTLQRRVLNLSESLGQF